MECCIEIDSFFKIPIAYSKWQLCKKTSTYSYRLKKVAVGDTFGHEEMLHDMKRVCRVRVTSTTTLLRANQEQFNECYPGDQLAHLRDSILEMDKEKIAARILKNKALLKRQSTAILDGTKLNKSEIGGRAHDDQKLSHKIEKLRAWVEKKSDASIN